MSKIEIQQSKNNAFDVNKEINKLREEINSPTVGIEESLKGREGLVAAETLSFENKSKVLTDSSKGLKKLEFEIKSDPKNISRFIYTSLAQAA